MATLLDAAARPRSRTIAGIACIEIGMLLFVCQDGLMKSLLGEFTLWTLMLARTLVAVLVLTPLILVLGAPHRLLTPLWPLHLARASLFAFGFSMFYTAFPFMGLAALTTIFFSAPLFTALLAAVFLGETIGVHRIGCLMVGFAGVVIAMNPSAETFQWVALLPFACAMSYATSQVLARRIGERETSLTMGLYTIVFAGVLIVPLGYMVNLAFDPGPEFRHIRWDWQFPDPERIAILALLGVIGMAGYIMLSRAYQIANASLIAPFDYTYLPLATAMAWLVWGEVPSLHTVAGMALIVGSGLYLGYREVMQTRRRIDPPPTAEAVFVPGSPGGGLIHTSDVQGRQGAET